MTQAEIDRDEHYTGNNYTVFSSDCYIYKTQTLDFKSSETYKSITLQLIPEKMVEEIHASENPDAVFILPVRLTSQTDSVNTDKCDLILKPKITELGIAFKKGSKTINLSDNKENSIIFFQIVAGRSRIRNRQSVSSSVVNFQRIRIGIRPLISVHRNRHSHTRISSFIRVSV